MEILDGLVCLLEFHVAHTDLICEFCVVLGLIVGRGVMLDGKLVFSESEIVGPDVEVGQDVIFLDLKIFEGLKIFGDTLRHLR